MKIGVLKNQLSAYLRHVRNGEEVVVLDRDKPVARILPFADRTISDEEARLVAEGKMTLPKEQMDWDAFFELPTGNVPREVAIRAVIESRGDR
ncbi:MAG: type II toxin-antitoxin system prevent-host-death family antitoxin [Acidobacteriaceae bacterium]